VPVDHRHRRLFCRWHSHVRLCGIWPELDLDHSSARESMVWFSFVDLAHAVAALLAAQRTIDPNVISRLLLNLGRDLAAASFALDDKDCRCRNSPLLAVVKTHRPKILSWKR
jgi:hypothetical protein